MIYKTKWDLTSIPDVALFGELDRRKQFWQVPKPGPKPKLAPCPKCGQMLGVRARQEACPLHKRKSERELEQ